MPRYETKDFSRCFFNPLEKNLLKTYPELEAITGNVVLLRYILLLYDHRSPLVHQYLDPKKRKEAAADLAGYEDNELLEDVFSCKSATVREAIVAFLKTYRFPREWFMICANEQTLYEYGERMMKPIDEAEAKEKDIIQAIAVKSKLSEDMEAINKRIEAGYKKLFGDDEDLYKVVQTMTTAESMATSV